MRALDVFNKEFADILSQLPATPVTPELVVPELPCEHGMRTVDDVLADFGKTIEGPKARATLDHVRKACADLGFKSAAFSHVRSDYYDLSLAERQRLLCAPSVECLCKSLILENKGCKEADCSDPLNSRYYCIVVQYVASINSQKIFNFVRELSHGPRKAYHFRMASSERAFELSGFEHNAISPVGMSCGLMPIIMAREITQLKEDWFWLGGGQVDLKLGFRVSEFIQRFKPFIADIYKDAGDEATTNEADEE